MAKSKRFTDASDDKWDARHGVKENSRKDKDIDRKRGVSEDDSMMKRPRALGLASSPMEDANGNAIMANGGSVSGYATGGQVACMKCGGSVKGYAAGGVVCVTCGNAPSLTFETSAGDGGTPGTKQNSRPNYKK